MNRRSAEHVQIDAQPQSLGGTLHAPIEGDQGAVDQRGEREVLRVIGSRPAQLVGDPPCLPPQATVPAFSHHTRLEEGEGALHHSLGDDPAPLCGVKSRASLRPEERWCDKLLVPKGPKAALARGGRQNDVRIEDEHAQRASRSSRTSVTQSGIGSPVHVVRQPSGSDCPTASPRSSSSMRCCVPIFCDRSRPERIQRRIVSGFLPVRRAASGTVSTVVEYYNTEWQAHS
jgi:hypothetical protein